MLNSLLQIAPTHPSEVELKAPKEEVIYPFISLDADGKGLDASKARYTIRFPGDQLPPAKFFWSLTLSELPQRLLVAEAAHGPLILRIGYSPSRCLSGAPCSASR